MPLVRTMVVAYKRCSTTCRLPQTPRTPSIGMAHYFDDMFQRSIDVGTPRSSAMPRIRRSSTARSIGARSDFDTAEDEDEDSRSVANSEFPDGPARAREKAVADSHLHHYISDQLERYKSQNGDFELKDEFEATP